MELHKRRVIWLLTIMLFAAALIAATVDISFSLRRSEPAPIWQTEMFDDQKWKISGPDDRGRMVFDLLGTCQVNAQYASRVFLPQHSVLHGRTKKQILLLLGTPDVHAHDHFTYRIGYLDRDPSGYLVEPVSLILEFNVGGTVVSYILSS